MRAPLRGDGSDPAPDAPDGGDHPPVSPSTPEAPICELCGAAMLDRHCKVVCLNCGYQRDCSDP